MRDFIVKLLSQESTWKKIFSGIAIISTGSVTFLDPKIAGFVGIGFLALMSPAGKLVAKLISQMTANYAQTNSTLDDIAHAASEAVLDMTVGKDVPAPKK